MDMAGVGHCERDMDCDHPQTMSTLDIASDEPSDSEVPCMPLTSRSELRKRDLKDLKEGVDVPTKAKDRIRIRDLYRAQPA